MYARDAYEIADALLAASEKKEGNAPDEVNDACSKFVEAPSWKRLGLGAFIHIDVLFKLV